MESLTPFVSTQKYKMKRKNGFVYAQKYKIGSMTPFVLTQKCKIKIKNEFMYT